MSQPRRIPRHFVLSHDQNGVAVPNEESQNRLLTVPDNTEQMEFNIRYHIVLILPSQTHVQNPRLTIYYAKRLL